MEVEAGMEAQLAVAEVAETLVAILDVAAMLVAAVDETETSV